MICEGRWGTIVEGAALCHKWTALIQFISKIQKLFYVKRKHFSLMSGTRDGVVCTVKTNCIYALLICLTYGTQLQSCSKTILCCQFVIHGIYKVRQIVTTIEMN